MESHSVHSGRPAFSLYLFCDLSMLLCVSGVYSFLLLSSVPLCGYSTDLFTT